jgi:hypothetical protein
VHHSGLFHDKTITVQLVDVTTRIGKGNFVDFIGVQPNLALAAFQNVGREALLQFQGNCRREQER